jgi:methylated-DNA-[protein]-cysteine S-methyltransferase
MSARPHAGSQILITTFDTDLGWMAIASADQILAQLSFGHPSPKTAADSLGLDHRAPRSRQAWPELVERLAAYAAGEPVDFADIRVDLARLTAFGRRVIDGCRRIPFGQTLTYGRLAILAGAPGAARAVGNIMATNRCPLVIPCHRVVQAGGQIGRYSAASGRRMKLRLLEQEGALPADRVRWPAKIG